LESVGRKRIKWVMRKGEECEGVLGDREKEIKLRVLGKESIGGRNSGIILEMRG
jgi:hypothetical protein